MAKADAELLRSLRREIGAPSRPATHHHAAGRGNDGGNGGSGGGGGGGGGGGAYGGGGYAGATAGGSGSGPSRRMVGSAGGFSDLSSMGLLRGTNQDDIAFEVRQQYYLPGASFP